MTNEEWTVGRILEWIEGYLAEHGDDNSRVSAQWLVGSALNLSRMELYLNLDRNLTEDERGLLRDFTRRRAQGEPLQYITGEAPFRHITVKVAPGVLIPRPETEVLVSEALALLPPAQKYESEINAHLLTQLKALIVERGHEEVEEALRESFSDEEVDALLPYLADETVKNAGYLIADIGTGSGCIACSLATERADVHVIATDISQDACDLAKENSLNLQLSERIDILESNLGDAIDPALYGSFDLVVSNPPYIPTAVLSTIPQEVTAFEPALALDGGEDGLEVFRQLLEFCQKALKPGGGFAFELHETRLDTAAELATQRGFTDIRIIKDLAQKPRVLTGRKPNDA